jgi:hypothetical protein
VRRIVSLGTVLAVLAALVAAIAAQNAFAGDAPTLSPSKARTLSKAFVKKRAMTQNNANNPHGVPTNWGVVKAGDCEQISDRTVECAYGIFWADGHQCFNRARVRGIKFKRGVWVTFSVGRGFPRDACDDEGTTNGGSSTPGTATDIDPEGRGPLAPADDEDTDPTGGNDDGQ